MAGKLGVAIMGLGRGSGTRLQKLIAASQDKIQVKWLVDKDVEKAQSLLKTIQPEAGTPAITKPWYWDQVCKDKSVDAVLVCSPFVNVNMVRRALRKGKAVMCDRPMSLQTEAVLACYEEAEGSKRPLVFSFTRRFDQILREIKRLIQSGEIGTVHAVRTSACYSPQSSGDLYQDKGSIFRDCVSQDADAISWLLGETPNSVFATGSGIMCEGGHDTLENENVSLTLRYPSGTMATVDIRRSSCDHENHFEVSGSSGILLLDPHHAEGTAIITVGKSGSQTHILPDSYTDRHDDAFIRAVHHFTDVVQGKSKPETTVIDTLRAVSVASACKDSHLSNSEVARETERHCEMPESILQKPMWKEIPALHPNVAYVTN